MRSEEQMDLEEALTRDVVQLNSAVYMRQFGAIPEYCEHLIERLRVLAEVAEQASDRQPYIQVCEWAVDQARAAICERSRLNRTACHQWAREHLYDPEVIEHLVAASFVGVLGATERLQRIIRDELATHRSEYPC